MVAADLVISPFILAIDFTLSGQLCEGRAVLFQEIAVGISVTRWVIFWSLA